MHFSSLKMEFFLFYWHVRRVSEARSKKCSIYVGDLSHTIVCNPLSPLHYRFNRLI